MPQTLLDQAYHRLCRLLMSIGVWNLNRSTASTTRPVPTPYTPARTRMQAIAHGVSSHVRKRKGDAQ